MRKDTQNDMAEMARAFMDALDRVQEQKREAATEVIEAAFNAEPISVTMRRVFEERAQSKEKENHYE